MRPESRGALALEIALAAARRHGGLTQTLNLRLMDVPLYRPNAGSTTALQQMNQAVTWANAFVLATPDYHGSMSGAMKNFLDYHHREFSGKLFGYLCTSHEKGLTPMSHMRSAVRQCYGWSLPYGLCIHPDEDFDAQGQLKNPRLVSRLAMLGRDLVVYGQMIWEQFQRDLASTEQETFAAKYR